MATVTLKRWAACLACSLLLLLSACETGGSTTGTLNTPDTTAQVTTSTSAPTVNSAPTVTSTAKQWRPHQRGHTVAYGAGEYWWDPATPVGLHTHFPAGASGVVIEIGPLTDDFCVRIDLCTDIAELETAPAVIDGHDGVYWHSEGGDAFWRELWLVDIEDTKILITIGTPPVVMAGDLAMAHTIVFSIRTEPWENEAGFRMTFTIPDEWY